MTGSTSQRGVGLAALLQSGLAGWLRAVGTCVSAVPSAAISTSRSTAADEASSTTATSPMGLMPSMHYTEAARLD
jgi:hypothetical protein